MARETAADTPESTVAQGIFGHHVIRATVACGTLRDAPKQATKCSEDLVEGLYAPSLCDFLCRKPVCALLIQDLLGACN